MRLFLVCAAACASLAVASCGTASSDRHADGDSGQAGEAEGAAGNVSRAGASGRAAGGSSGGAGTGSSSESAGESGASSGGSGPPQAGQISTGGSAGAAAAELGGASGDEEVPAGNAGTAGMSSGAGAGGGALGPPLVGECTAPCELLLGPSDNLPGDSAVVHYDFLTNTATLTSDPEVNAASMWVIGFSHESDPESGYGSWSTNGWWFAFTEPLAYGVGTSSILQNVEITSQMVNPTTNQILRVVYSFGDESVRIHAIGVPDCDAATSGACATPSDCVPVEAGTLRATAEMCFGTCGSATACVSSCVAEARAISLGCSSCYAEFLACATNNCPTECPGLGSKACMACETASDCHLAFMACSGLDYMPPGTLTWPLGQPRL